jgi:glycosyltransferase involved in cell wall biosynthesis
MEVWERVAILMPTATLTLIGVGPLLDTVKAWCEKHPAVELIVDPPRSVIHERLNRAKALVLLSQPEKRWREQNPLPILEALSHGCEVISSDQSGTATWLADNGHRVVPWDAADEEVAEAICEALNASRLPQEITRCLPSEDGHNVALKWMWGVV